MRVPRLSRPLGALATCAAFLGVVLMTPAGEALQNGSPRTVRDPIAGVLTTLEATGFHAVNVDDVATLFSKRQASQLTASGAPVVVRWAETSGICAIEFEAGSVRWGDQVAAVQVRCDSADQAAARKRILGYVKLLSPGSVAHTSDSLKRGFGSLNLDWAQGAWVRAGASISVSGGSESGRGRYGLRIDFPNGTPDGTNP